MGSPSQPHFLKEGAANLCIIHGKNLTWTQCTVLSSCMLCDASTLGVKRPDPCHFRDIMNDESGGTTIPQCASILQSVYHVPVEQHTGSNVSSVYYLAYQIGLGRKAVLQGNTQPDGRGNINHAIEANQVIGGTPGHPREWVIFDPWSGGKAVWSHAKVEAFLAALHPWGENDSRKLGPGKAYCMLGPDVEPHVHIKFGAARTSPFPDRTRVYSAYAGRKVNVRSGPGTGYTKLGTIVDGTLWIAYQKIGHWYGNHNGNQWIHDSGLRYEGGKS